MNEIEMRWCDAVQILENETTADRWEVMEAHNFIHDYISARTNTHIHGETLDIYISERSWSNADTESAIIEEWQYKLDRVYRCYSPSYQPLSVQGKADSKEDNECGKII